MNPEARTPSRDIRAATQAAREAAQAHPRTSRLRRFLCAISPCKVYDEQPRYAGEGRHTYKRGLHAWGPPVLWQCGCNFYNIRVCRTCGLTLKDHQWFDPCPPPPVDKPNPDPMPSPPPGHHWAVRTTKSIDYLELDLLDGRNNIVDSQVETIYFAGLHRCTPHEAAVAAAKAILARRGENLRLAADLGIQTKKP